MTKICLVGAGSTVFAQSILGDVLSIPELQHAQISLFDIDAERLETSLTVTRRIGESLGIKDLKVSTHTERRPALEGADFVILMMQVGGYKPATVTDFEIPAKFGLGQTIGDTLGIGGIMRGLRTIPVLFDICRDMEDLCPDATLLQYVNPMAINCWATKERFPNIKTVGLCHSVQETAHELAESLGVDPNALHYRCGGINHVAFYTKFELVNPDGTREDLYPRLKKMAHDRTYPEYDEVRFDMLRRVGHFVTESSMHFSEYNSWYLKGTQPEVTAKNQLRIGEYLFRCEDQIAEWRELQKELEGGAPIEVCRSNEYAAGIIEGIVTGVPQTIWGNVPNNGLIAALPDDCIVEVPCHVDRNGITPMRAEPMPSMLTSIMGQSIAVQREVVNAAISGEKNSIYHAAMLDPHTSAELTLEQITVMVDELLVAHSDWLPSYQ